MSKGRDRCAIHRELSFEYMAIDHEQALEHARLATSFSKYESDPLMLIRIQRYKGMIMRRLNMLDSALIVLYKVREEAISENYEEELFRIQNSMGVAYILKANYDLALDWYFRTLGLPVVQNDQKLRATILANLGFVYYKMKDPREALTYLKTAMPNFSHGSYEWIKTTTNIILCYTALNDSINTLRYLTSMEKAETLGDEDRVELLYAKANFYMTFKEIDVAEKYYNKCLLLADSVSYTRFQIESLLGLSGIDEIHGASDRSIDKLKEAEGRLEGTEMSTEAKEIYERLSRNYSKLKNWEYANVYQEKYKSMEEDERNASYRALRNIELNFLKSQQSEQISQKNEIIEARDLKIQWQYLALVATGIMIIILAMHLILVFKLYKYRKRMSLELDGLIKERTVKLYAELNDIRLQHKAEKNVGSKKLKMALHSVRNIRSLISITGSHSISDGSDVRLKQELASLERMLELMVTSDTREKVGL